MGRDRWGVVLHTKGGEKDDLQMFDSKQEAQANGEEFVREGRQPAHRAQQPATRTARTEEIMASPEPLNHVSAAEEKKVKRLILTSDIVRLTAKKLGITLAQAVDRAEKNFQSLCKGKTVCRREEPDSSVKLFADPNHEDLILTQFDPRVKDSMGNYNPPLRASSEAEGFSIGNTVNPIPYRDRPSYGYLDLGDVGAGNYSGIELRFDDSVRT